MKFLSFFIICLGFSQSTLAATGCNWFSTVGVFQNVGSFLTAHDGITYKEVFENYSCGGTCEVETFFGTEERICAPKAPEDAGGGIQIMECGCSEFTVRRDYNVVDNVSGF